MNGWFYIVEYKYAAPMVSIIRQTEEEIITAFTHLDFTSVSAIRVTLYEMKAGVSNDIRVLWERKF